MSDSRFDGLPGGELVAQGLTDLASGKPTAEAALVQIAWTRLRDLGMTLPARTVGDEDAEIVLYRRLGERDPEGDAYGAYCAWLDQLVSFMSALERERRRSPRS